MAGEVLDVKVEKLQRDFDSHVLEDKGDRRRMFDKLDAILERYASRLPNWGTVIFGILMGLLGVLATMAVIGRG